MNKIWCEECDAEMDAVYSEDNKVWCCIGCNGIVEEKIRYDKLENITKVREVGK